MYKLTFPKFKIIILQVINKLAFFGRINTYKSKVSKEQTPKDTGTYRKARHTFGWALNKGVLKE